MALSLSLLLFVCISIILFPLICPSLTIADVSYHVQNHFLAVPAFILVLPVINSGPTTTSIGNFENFANGVL